MVFRMVLLPVVLAVLLLLLFLLRLGKNVKRVYIVVLGDIGRSPRMQYHAMSFATAGFEVYLFGYGGSELHSELKTNASVHLVHLWPIPASFQRLPRLLVFISKVLWQSVTLTVSLLYCRRPSHILVQNPPSLPTLAICWIVSIIKASKFVIDWHNYGYTIMALSVGRQHSLTRIYEWYERVFGRFSTDNICVTQAMRKDLLNNWSVRATTMYDRPPLIFRSMELKEKHNFLYSYKMFRYGELETMDNGRQLTTFTERDATGSVRYRSDRPALVISSTSWTEDEDFSILLSALDRYDREASVPGASLPSLVCVITGKGPQKEHYLNVIKTKNWSRVSVFTPWLEPDDYPRLLACADLGVCLHKSSSGLDLPMKVIDMFGCGLPVCAVWFKSLSELVKHDQNGLVFNSESELAQQLQKLLHGFPDQCALLEKFRDNLKAFQEVRWSNVWEESVLPIFSSDN